MPTIVALVKNVPDTWSTKKLSEDHTLDRDAVDEVLDEVNEYSVEAALRLRESDPDAGWRVVALTVGPAGADEALRRAIAMGADDAVHVLDDALAGSDVLGTAWTVAAAVAKLDDVRLIVAGGASSDGAVGALPGIVAEYRQCPALTELRAVALEGDTVTGTRGDAHGHRGPPPPLPAVVSVTDKADKPRFPNFKGLMAAKKHEITTWDLAAIGVTPEQVGLEHAATRVTGANERAARTAGETVRGPESAAKVLAFLDDENLL